MGCKRECRDVGPVTIIRVTGRVVLGDGDDLVYRTVCDQLGRGKTRIVLDIGGVKYIDGAGLACLVRCHSTAVSLGGTVKLVAAGRVHDLLSLTKLEGVYEVYSDDMLAIASYISPVVARVAA